MFSSKIYRSRLHPIYKFDAEHCCSSSTVCNCPFVRNLRQFKRCNCRKEETLLNHCTILNVSGPDLESYQNYNPDYVDTICRSSRRFCKNTRFIGENTRNQYLEAGVKTQLIMYILQHVSTFVSRARMCVCDFRYVTRQYNQQTPPNVRL